MSYPEFLQWVAYRNQYGVLTMQKRLERVCAMFFHQQSGGKVPVEDLLFFSESTEKSEDLELEEAIRTWK